MKKFFRILVSLLALTALLLSFCSCGIISNILTAGDEEKFYDLVSDTKDLLDVLADDIYKNWYDSIYEDKFDSDIDKAIDEAFEDNDFEFDLILENTIQIEDLYKSIKDGRLSDEAKDVMQAYNEYYGIVIEVSGSFNDFQDTKEPAKKALASALKNYNSEM